MMRMGAAHLADLGKSARVAGVLPAHDDHDVNARGELGGAVLALLRGGADGVDDAQLRRARKKRGDDRAQRAHGLRRLHHDAHLARQLDGVEVGGRGDHAGALIGVSHDALDLGVAALPHDDELIALAHELLRGHVHLFDVGACGVQHRQPQTLGPVDDLGHDAMGADDHRSGIDLLDAIGHRHAGMLELGDDQRVMDERAERADRTARLARRFRRKGQGALDAVAYAGMAGDLDGECHCQNLPG